MKSLLISEMSIPRQLTSLSFVGTKSTTTTRSCELGSAWMKCMSMYGASNCTFTEVCATWSGSTPRCANAARCGSCAVQP